MASLSTAQELVIPQPYREITINGDAEEFLLYDSMDRIQPGRILIFSTRQNLQLLSQSQEWFADGTFSTAPQLFQQLYTIHVIRYHTVIPVVYALLPNKTRASYIHMLQALKNLQHGLQPQQLMTDFEQAAMQAFDLEFPGIIKTGCFFHLTQNVYRKVQAEGLQQQYHDDHEFARWVRMIPALAFVHLPDVVRYFEELTENADFPDSALPISNYFEDTYIGRLQRRRRQPPLFPIDIWNVYDRTLNQQHRTNNAVEGWHRGFQATCGIHFPNIFRFIDAIKRQQALHNFEITQLVAGNPVNRQNRRYAMMDVRIRTIAQDYANRNTIEYLRGIAYNFEF